MALKSTDEKSMAVRGGISESGKPYLCLDLADGGDPIFFGMQYCGITKNNRIFFSSKEMLWEGNREGLERLCSFLAQELGWDVKSEE